jgi:hypothetical protein
LEVPASYDVIDPLSGLPEKQGPCGNEDPQTLTNTVTAFQEGQSITITINEVVFHPGHYRVALAMNPDHMQASFPDDPVPTPGSTNSGTMLCPNNLDMMACGSVPIEDPPVFPVIADNLFEHCMPFADPVTGNPQPQSTTIKLPAGVTCNKCTLQVLEFRPSTAEAPAALVRRGEERRRRADARLRRFRAAIVSSGPLLQRLQPRSGWFFVTVVAPGSASRSRD